MSLRGFCLATLPDGRMCGRAASNIDPERGCVVCDEHRPSGAPSAIPILLRLPAGGWCTTQRRIEKPEGNARRQGE